MTPFSSLAQCQKEWNVVFKSKSGNEYTAKQIFEKKPNKYNLMTTDLVTSRELVQKFDYSMEDLSLSE
jgi:hypothetical protein